VDTIVFVAILLLLVAPAVEIVVRRPGIFLELIRARDLRVFAETPLPKPSSSAVANDQRASTPRSGEDRLAA
jgi:hypothetical protein